MANTTITQTVGALPLAGVAATLLMTVLPYASVEEQ